MNPRVGSGVQQTRDLRAEKAVEAVRNREDGTGLSSLAARSRRAGRRRPVREWTHGGMTTEGRAARERQDESQERRQRAKAVYRSSAREARTEGEL